MSGRRAEPAIPSLPMPAPTSPANLALTRTEAPTASVIDITPVKELLEKITGELATLKRLSPNSDACAAISDIRLRLVNAITEGASSELWISADEFARREGVTASAITYRCRKGKLTHRKVGGRYLVNARSLPEAA